MGTALIDRAHVMAAALDCMPFYRTAILTEAIWVILILSRLQEVFKAIACHSLELLFE